MLPLTYRRCLGGADARPSGRAWRWGRARKAPWGAEAAGDVPSRRGDYGVEGVDGRFPAAVLHRAGRACDDRAGPQPVRGAFYGLVPFIRRLRRSPRRRPCLRRAARSRGPEAERPAASVGAVGCARPLLRGLGACGGGVPGRVDDGLARGVVACIARHGVARGLDGARARAFLAPDRLRGDSGGVRRRVRGRIGLGAVRGVAARGPLGAARALRAHLPCRVCLRRAPGACRTCRLR